MISLTEVWNGVKSVAGIITLLSFVIEFTPIKLHPLTALGRVFTKDLRKEISGVKDDVNKLNDKVQETENSLMEKIDTNDNKQTIRYIKQLRGEFLNFSNSCMKGQLHTKDEFDHALEVYDEYKDLIEENNLTNGRATVEHEYVLGIYKKCLKEDSFL